MKQYFHYFRFWYIALAAMLAVTAGVFGLRYFTNGRQMPRNNFECPEERVFDDADVLTAEEEDKLRALIAETEAKTGCDIVLVTINQSVLDLYGYENNTDANWNTAMRDYADDFYDLNNYGYNRVHGDGVLLLDNWYEGAKGSEKGSWLSTCGKVYEKYSYRMIDEVLDNVYDEIESNPYRAYAEYVKTVERHMMKRERVITPISPITCFMIALIPAILFIVRHLKNKEGKKDTVQTTYVDFEHGGAPVFSVQRDELINKYVTSHKIQTDSGSSGGHSSSGGGRAGGHSSSSGVSHGGGGRRR